MAKEQKADQIGKAIDERLADRKDTAALKKALEAERQRAAAKARSAETADTTGDEPDDLWDNVPI